jgi:hypothetical protein
LTFNINSPEGCSASSFEELACFAGEELDAVLAFGKKLAPFIFAYKLSSICVRLKPQFFGDESKFDVWLVSGRQSVSTSDMKT